MTSDSTNLMTTPPHIAGSVDVDREPQPPPREPTPRSRRRAWTEPNVRFWWLAAIVFIVAAIYFTISQIRNMSREARLIREGVSINALVLKAAGEPVTGKKRPPDSECELSYEYNRIPHMVVGRLEGRKEWIEVGSKVPIFIDANEPEVWTGRTVAGSASLNDWLAPLIILPIALIVFLVAFLKRNRLMRLWRSGEAVSALALDSRQTALAPRSRAVRLTPADTDDRRIYTVFIPRSAPVAEGDRFWLLVPPDGRGPVAAASWFQ